MDLDFANSLIADNRTIVDALIDEAKLIAAQGGPHEQIIKIEGGLPDLPGTNIAMPVLNGINGNAIDGIPASAEANASNPEMNSEKASAQLAPPTESNPEPPDAS